MSDVINFVTKHHHFHEKSAPFYLVEFEGSALMQSQVLTWKNKSVAKKSFIAGRRKKGGNKDFVGQAEKI